MSHNSLGKTECISLKINISEISLEFFLEQVERLTAENYIREFKAEYIFAGKTEDDAVRDYFPTLAGMLGHHLKWIHEHLKTAQVVKEET